MKSPKRYLITSALPYANGPLHIGHIAGAYLPADIFVKYLKMQGKEVLYVCGSDEHGAAITLKAKKEGKSPQQIVDLYHQLIKESFEQFGINFDVYHRTSSELHHQTSSEFFKNLYDKNIFTEISSEQFYDEEYKQFLADRYISGTCPKCNHDKAYGDQCEKCGSTLSPDELINPVSVLSGKSPVKKTTSHWYLPMNEHEEWVKEWISKGILNGKEHHKADLWKSNVMGQCKSWLDAGLQARAMTRDLDWGVKVPLPNAAGKVLYVWLDAPIGYISATKEWANKNGANWEDYWKNDDTHLIHFIGKDNIVFHCIIFPIILKAHGGYNLPVNVPANEFLNLEGDKISTSRNHAVWLHEYMQDFPGKADELRYVLCSIAPETKDSEFTWKDFQARVNNELVAIFGNFVNRTLVLTHKYYNGVVPELPLNLAESSQLLEECNSKIPIIEKAIEAYKFREALFECINLARAGNKFLADAEPWKIAASEPEKVKSIMHLALQLCAKLSIVFSPFLPQKAKKLQQMLSLEKLNWEDAKRTDLLVAGHQINKAELLFEKIEDKDVEAQIAKLEQAKKLNMIQANTKSNVDFDTFTSMDLRLGKILAAQKVPKADKLLLLSVNVGSEVRTIVSGIAKHYTADEIVGKTVLLLANLAPRKIMGIESQGMILMAENANGELSFMSPEKAGFTEGDNVK
jgi:methionyl-tRNA synthetase